MNYKREIYEILKDLGVPANIKGYHYTSEIVEGYLTGKYSINDKFTVVYSEAAKVFDTTGSRVERAIRHALEMCLKYTDREVLYKYFGNVFKRYKMTNSEFVFGLVEYIKIHKLNGES